MAEEAQKPDLSLVYDDEDGEEQYPMPDEDEDFESWIKQESGGQWAKARKLINWYLRHMREQQQAREEIAEEFEREIDRLERRRDNLLEQYDQEIERCEIMLQSAARDFRSEIMAQTPGKKKTLDLQQGSIGFREQGDKIEYEDEETLVAWVEDNVSDFETMAELLNVKKSVYKRELKDRIKWMDGVAHFVDDATGELKPLVVTIDEGGAEGRNEREVYLVRKEHRPEKIDIKPVT